MVFKKSDKISEDLLKWNITNKGLRIKLIQHVYLIHMLMIKVMMVIIQYETVDLESIMNR